jgi:translation initiation factor IF-2
LNRVPSAGDSIISAKDENQAKEVAEARLSYMKSQLSSQTSKLILNQANSIATGEFDNRKLIKVPIVIKGDVAGSIEAITTALQEIVASDDEAICKVDIVFSNVGDVTTSDVAIASAAKAKVLAFNVAASTSAMEEARSNNNLDIQYFNVLYDLLDYVRDIISKTITPPPPGLVLGTATIKKIFKIGKTGKIAGSIVNTGKIVSNANIRVLRGKTPIFTGVLSSLKVIKDDVPEVGEGNECGISIKGFEEFVEGDIIECFQTFDESQE